MAVDSKSDTEDVESEQPRGYDNTARNYAPQEYFCNWCRVTQTTKGIPNGWYIVKRSEGTDRNLKTSGITCSLPCLLYDVTRALVAKVAPNRY